MEKRNKLILILVSSVALLFVIIAIVETVSLSSKTVDEAFEKFIKREFKTENKKNEIGDKVVYPYGNGDYELVTYEMNGHVSLVRFEKGLFGWRQTYYSNNNQNEDYSYSTNNELLYGVIPEDIINKTESVKINNVDAKIITLTDKAKVWIMIKDEDANYNLGNISVNFLDNAGKVIGKM